MAGAVCTLYIFEASGSAAPVFNDRLIDVAHDFQGSVSLKASVPSGMYMLSV